MTPISFPSSPSIGQTQITGLSQYSFNEIQWDVKQITNSKNLGTQGIQGSQGPTSLDFTSMLKSPSGSNYTLSSSSLYIPAGKYNITQTSTANIFKLGDSYIYGSGQITLSSPTNTARTITLSTTTNAVWTTRAISGLTQPYWAKYLNNLYFIGGQAGGNIFSSTDTVTWTARATGTAAPFTYDATYGNGKYVIAQSNGTVSISTNLTTWTQENIPAAATTTIRQIVYGNGLFVAGANNGTISTSTDAITWTTSTGTTPPFVFKLIYGGGKFLAGGGSGVLSVSTDALTWSTVSTGLNAAYGFGALGYGNGVYIAAGNYSVYKSTDAITWTGATPSSYVTFFGMGYDGNVIFATGNGGAQAAFTYDGTVWKTISGMTYIGNGNLFLYGNGIYLVASGGNIYTTTSIGGNNIADNYSLIEKMTVV